MWLCRNHNDEQEKFHVNLRKLRWVWSTYMSGWLLFLNLHFSGAIVWITNLICSSSLSTSARVIIRWTIGSTAILSLLRTHSNVSNFRNLFRIVRPLQSTEYATAPDYSSVSRSNSINQFDQLHFTLFPKWTTSGKRTASTSSGGKAEVSANESSSSNACLLHSSQSVTIAITTTFKQVLHAINDGMWDTWPFSWHTEHTDSKVKQSSHRLIQSDVSLVTIWFSHCFLFRHLSHVCIVETLFFILDSIFSPETYLGW